MPCISGRFDLAVGPLITVAVTQAGGLAAAKAAAAAQPIQIPMFPGLLDTGAGSTCVSPTVVQALGLQPIGKRPMVSATQIAPVNVYLVDVIVPFGPANFLIEGAQVMEFASPGSGPFQILIGRDIICRGTLSLSFDGHFTFAL